MTVNDRKYFLSLASRSYFLTQSRRERRVALASLVLASGRIHPAKPTSKGVATCLREIRAIRVRPKGSACE